MGEWRKYIIEFAEDPTKIRLMKLQNGENGLPCMKFETVTPYEEPDLEQVRKEAYEKGLNDAWEAAKKICLPEDHGGLGYETCVKVFDTDNIEWLLNLSASEAIEKLNAYEEKKKEEQEIKVEDVMRQYLYTFCSNHRCLDDECPLHTPEFTCGRGKHFLSLPHDRVSDEEVRRAYAKVIKEYGMPYQKFL